MKRLFNAEYRVLIFPLLLEQLFMTVIGTLSVFLFSLFNDNVVATISISEQILNIGSMFMGAVGLGSGILILGYADYENTGILKDILKQSIFLNIIIGGVIFILNLLFAPIFIRLIQTPLELRLMAVNYLRIISISLIFIGIQGVFTSLLRAYGRVNSAMRVSVLGAVLNLCGNFSVIMFFSRDLKGVYYLGIATVFARFLSLIYGAFKIKNDLDLFDDYGEKARSDFSIGKRIIKLGFPQAMENVFYNFSQTIITAFIAGIGTDAVSGGVYARSITSIIFSIGVAAGIAGQIIIARMLRKGQFEELKKFAYLNSVSISMIAFIIAVVIAIFGREILNLFTENPEILKIAGFLLWMQVLYEPLRVSNEILISGLNALCDVKYPVITAFVVTYLFTIPLIYLITQFFNGGIYAIWAVFILDEGIRAILFHRRIRRKNLETLVEG